MARVSFSWALKEEGRREGRGAEGRVFQGLKKEAGRKLRIFKPQKGTYGSCSRTLEPRLSNSGADDVVRGRGGVRRWAEEGGEEGKGGERGEGRRTRGGRRRRKDGEEKILREGS